MFGVCSGGQVTDAVFYMHGRVVLHLAEGLVGILVPLSF